MRSLVVTPLFLLALAARPAHAAGLHRCIGADGGSIFTDQSCEDIGASARPELVPTSGAAVTGRLHARGCARTTDGLLHGLRTALTAGDVNQLSAFYHWPGIGSVESDGILTRLQAIAGRSLVSAELIRQGPPRNTDSEQASASVQLPEASGIEVVQARSGNDPTPVHTVFSLTEYMGCWWVRF